MAKRGPKPSPREALELRGSRHIKQDEYNGRLEPPAWTPPAPPDHFDENARIFWLYYAPLFIDYGVLNALTCPAFELMCSEYGRFKETRGNMENPDLDRCRRFRLVSPLEGVTLLKWRPGGGAGQGSNGKYELSKLK